MKTTASASGLGVVYGVLDTLRTPVTGAVVRQPTFRVVRNDGHVVAQGCSETGAQWLASVGAGRRIEAE